VSEEIFKKNVLSNEYMYIG